MFQHDFIMFYAMKDGRAASVKEADVEALLRENQSKAAESHERRGIFSGIEAALLHHFRRKPDLLDHEDQARQATETLRRYWS
jgi:hypothetical protein